MELCREKHKKGVKNVQEKIEKARKRLRIFLIAVVLLAVIVGCLYYFGDFGKEQDVTEGTLVRELQDTQIDARGLYSSNTFKTDASMQYRENMSNTEEWGQHMEKPSGKTEDLARHIERSSGMTENFGQHMEWPSGIKNVNSDRNLVVRVAGGPAYGW